VIFAQLVNDPGFQQGEGFKYGVNKKEAARERQRLFKIIEDLVIWENTNNEKVLDAARAEIRRSWKEVCELNKDHPEAGELFNPDKMPGLHDPFAGGGSIPLEAQRLGLEAYASDLNPVAVLINKAMIEIPPIFAGQDPVNPHARNERTIVEKKWHGTAGLAEDVRYYGNWMREEALNRLGHFYPSIEITKDMVRERPDLRSCQGEKLTVIAWLWVRTVKSPNPAFSHVAVPLASTFILSSKQGKEAYVQPVIDKDDYRFIVKTGTPPADAKAGTKVARGANFRCIISNAAIEPGHVKREAMAGRMGARLIAIVAASNRSRVYLSPTTEHEAIAAAIDPGDTADVIRVPIAKDPRPMTCLLYGMTQFEHLFTPRQLATLTTFSDLVRESRSKVTTDAIANNKVTDGHSLATEHAAYANAISLYLACGVSKIANIGSTLASWMRDRGAFRETFARQALPIIWDYAEANCFAEAGGSFRTAMDKVAMAIETLPATGVGHALQLDASQQSQSRNRFVSTDPPYYDNIGYADLSDFFYIWLRRSLRDVYPELLATITVPKAEELVAAVYRHGTKHEAEKFFLNGMTHAMRSLSEQAHPAAPITIYYAFKQSETETDGTNSTGWETFLEAVNRANLALTGTWPIRTEGAGRIRSTGSNALASSIVLACRPRIEDSKTISRRDFIRELNEILPTALDEMTRGTGDGASPVAPVDLSQAMIGPGMAIFSKYSAVLEADGEPMTVRTALQLINRFLAEDVFDNDTQVCLAWFEENGWSEGDFGQADVLARAKATSVEGIAEAGVITSGGGNVQLLRWSEYPSDWDPDSDSRIPVWELLHHLIRLLKISESAAAEVLGHEKAAPLAAAARQLAYRLYTLCERKGWAEDAREYNEIITSWHAIEIATPMEVQPDLFE